MKEFPLIRVASCVSLIMIVGTWCYICIVNGQVMPIEDNLLWACGVLLSGNAGQLLADRFIPRK